jgi:hypothetical protein
LWRGTKLHGNEIRKTWSRKRTPRILDWYQPIATAVAQHWFIIARVAEVKNNSLGYLVKDKPHRLQVQAPQSYQARDELINILMAP